MNSLATIQLYGVKAAMVDDDLKIRKLESAFTAPADWYQASRNTQDIPTVIAPSWQFIGHHSQLSQQGDLMTTCFGNHPLLAVNDGEQVRGFYNVCQHRAGPLADGPGRCRGVLQCRYHGWRYHLDGRLAGTSEFAQAEDFHPDEIRLKPVALRQWRGLWFASVSDIEPTWALAELEKMIPQTTLANLSAANTQNYVVNANWKTYIDNYLEGYHLPFVHPGLSRQLRYREYVSQLTDHCSLQHSPFSWDGQSQDGHAWYAFIYPNTMLNILPGRLQINRVYPLTENRCEVSFDYYYSAEVSAALRQQDQADADQTQQEDIAICEQVQRGLNSPAYTRGRLSPKRESALHHFHNLLRRDYAESG